MWDSLKTETIMENLGQGFGAVIIEELNECIKLRPQFPDKPNLLTEEIITATKLELKEAMRVQSSVCKAITFWFEAYNKGLIDMDFPTYYAYCIDKGWIRKEDAWLFLEYGFTAGKLKTQMADKFDIDIIGFDDFKKFKTWANEQEKFVGTLRIVSNSGGKHSLITYKEDKDLCVSDTSYRGIGYDFDKRISSKNFLYFTCMTGLKNIENLA